MENSDSPEQLDLPGVLLEDSSEKDRQDCFESEPKFGFDSDESSEFQSFDPRNIEAEKLGGAIFIAICAVAMPVGLAIVYFTVTAGWIFYALLVAAAILFCLLVYFAVCWPAVEHRHRGWRLTEVGLEVKRGVWWKHMQAIPWARVQHADVSQGPIQRMFGVGTLTVHTAGTNNSSTNLGGLTHELAIRLRDEIIRQRAVNDVV